MEPQILNTLSKALSSLVWSHTLLVGASCFGLNRQPADRGQHFETFFAQEPLDVLLELETQDLQ